MGNYYSKNSLANLKTVSRDLKVIFGTVLKQHDHTIVCGLRGEKAQNQAFEDGGSLLKYPDSRHNFSLCVKPSLKYKVSDAVDAYPYFPEIGMSTDITDAIAFGAKVKQIADDLFEDGIVSHRLRWGADWDGDGQISDNTKFLDAGHFELIPNMLEVPDEDTVEVESPGNGEINEEVEELIDEGENDEFQEFA